MGRKKKPVEPRYYVYTLSYPPELGGRVFYVGMGSGNRINQHEYLASKGDPGERHDTIRGIWHTGARVVKNKVFRSDDKVEALIEEKRLIHYYGYSNLTNTDPTTLEWRATTEIPGRPLERAGHPTVTRSVAVWPDHWNQLVTLMSEEGRSMSEWVREKIASELKYFGVEIEYDPNEK
jgi:hypothetical protein